MPDVSLLPQRAIQKAVHAAITDERAVALQYGSTNGRLETRQALCDIMRDIGVRVKPEEMLLTSGAQQALNLLGETFLDKGDIVLVEGPTYLTALSAFNAYEFSRFTPCLSTTRACAWICWKRNSSASARATSA